MEQPISYRFLESPHGSDICRYLAKHLLIDAWKDLERVNINHNSVDIQRHIDNTDI